MSPYPANENISHRKFNNYHQSIIIAFDVENIVLITDIVSRKKIDFNIRQVFPFCFFSYIIPAFKGYARILVTFRLVEIF